MRPRELSAAALAISLSLACAWPLATQAEQTTPEGERQGSWSRAGEETSQAASAVGGAVAETAVDAYDATREFSGEAWSATREGASRAADYSVEKGGQAWDATRSTAGRLWRSVTDAVAGDAGSE